MNYCTKCGKKLEEGIEHVCEQPAIAKTYSYIRWDIILSIIKNPFRSQQLTEEDFVSGILGLVAVILSAFLWDLGIFHNMTAGISGLPVIGDYVRPNYLYLMMASFLLFGIPLLSIILLSNGMGNKKIGWKRAVTILCGSQWFSVVYVLIALLASYLSVGLSFAIFMIILLSDIILSIMIGLDTFEVPIEMKPVVVLLTITILVLMNSWIFDSMLKSVLNSIPSLFSIGSRGGF